MDTATDAQAQRLTRTLGEQFAALPQVKAVAVGGSRSGGHADAASDIDLYVYTRADIPLVVRQEIVRWVGGASRANLGLTYWGPGDEWFDAASGIEVDVVYFDAAWMEEQQRRVLERHEASLGYTTCFWRTIRSAQVLHDPRGWHRALQQQSERPYPEPLRRAIVALNRPVLREIIPSYLHQLEKAVRRRDLVSVNHRLAALLASYFDIIFAVNRVLHPGEKRMLEIAQRECALLPAELARDIPAALAAGADPERLPGILGGMLDRLDALLDAEAR